MKLAPLNDSIIFEFLDEIQDGYFATKTKSGIILQTQNPELNATLPRWGKVYAVGPEVKDVAVNDLILIAPLHWSTNFKFGEKRYNRAFEKDVLLIADDIEDLSQLYF
jgi:co-chaperonin GroES (HSP10)